MIRILFLLLIFFNFVSINANNNDEVEIINIIQTLMKQNHIPLLQFGYFTKEKSFFVQFELKENYDIM